MIEVKPNELKGNWSWIYRDDPALDLPENPDEADDVYRRYLDGVGDLPAKSGQSPTVWECRHLTEREVRRIMELHSLDRHLEAAYLAVAMSLVSIKQPEYVEKPDRVKDQQGFYRVSDAWMDAIGRIDHGGLINALYMRVTEVWRGQGN